MTYALIIILLLLVWAQLRNERVKNDTEWFFCITDTRKALREETRKALHEINQQVDAYADAYASMKRQLANRKGQITKLRRKGRPADHMEEVSV